MFASSFLIISAIVSTVLLCMFSVASNLLARSLSLRKKRTRRFRRFSGDSVPTRALRSASYYWYFKKNILVFEREPPTAWVDAPIASEMARQGTDMRRCGLNRCCRSAVEAQCIRGLRRNTTCMTAWLEA